MPSPQNDTGILTVAALRKTEDDGGMEYLFNERQQIFTVKPRGRPAEEISATLAEALRKSLPVKATLDPQRAHIHSVQMLSVQELDDFERQRTLLENPETGFPIELETIDPTTFNIVNDYLTVPIFGGCTNIVPNYAIAKEIFDFCAKQSCHLSGPYEISPCIPFQYVRDGCYARAHKMRWIISAGRFKYCCEKVFSFSNKNADRLAVRATKWGSCCVLWWYHVAPLIRVKADTLGSLAMVIDPGIFDKPEMLSTWLSVQENKTCNPHARVTMYSIQPGEAYTPANYGGTMFTTDPLYADTDATLKSYRNLRTCRTTPNSGKPN